VLSGAGTRCAEADADEGCLLNILWIVPRKVSLPDQVTVLVCRLIRDFANMDIKLAHYPDGSVVAIIPIPKTHPLSKQGVFILQNAIAIFQKNHQIFPSNSL
jgi:hypothetical protein